MKKDKILVTGAAGFIGSHLSKFLLDRGYKVYGVDDLSGGYERNIPKGLNFTKIDLRDKNATYKYIKKIRPDIIYHLAADASEGRSQFTPINCTERNYLAYLYLLVPAIKFGLKTILLTSSMSVYGSQKPPFEETMESKPDDIYGISKAAMERATEILSNVHKFNYVIVRPHNVYGPGQNLSDPYRNVLGIFINSLLNNKKFYIYGDGEQKRAFTYIDDLVPYIAKLGLDNRYHSEIFNLGPSKASTINEIADFVLKSFFGNKIPNGFKPVYLPLRPMEVKNAYCTSSKSERYLSYRPGVDLKEGIDRMVKWAKKLGGQKTVYLEELEIVNDSVPKTWVKKLI